MPISFWLGLWFQFITFIRSLGLLETPSRAPGLQGPSPQPAVVQGCNSQQDRRGWFSFPNLEQARVTRSIKSQNLKIMCLVHSQQTAPCRLYRQRWPTPQRNSALRSSGEILPAQTSLNGRQLSLHTRSHTVVCLFDFTVEARRICPFSYSQDKEGFRNKERKP